MILTDEPADALPDLALWSQVLPEPPDWPWEAPGTGVLTEPGPCPCGYGCAGVCEAEPAGWVLPELLEAPRPGTSEPVQAEVFAHHFAQVQAHTARMWRAAAAMISAAGAGRAEFVGDELALLMGVHPRTGRNLACTAWAAGQVPELLALVESAELSERHVVALLDEAGRWAAGDAVQQSELVEITLQRCRPRLAAGQGWPTPAQLRKRLATVAVLHDLTAADKASRSVADKRGVSAWPTGAGAAALTIEGPQVQVGRMREAIEARAQALGAQPGDTRTLDQRRYDAAYELLTVDAAGGPSAVPAVGPDGEPVTVTVRGIQVALLMPVSVAAGGELELAEIPGLGPVLPATARELLAHADTVQRITVDATTGQVLSVDRPVPGPVPVPGPLQHPGTPRGADPADPAVVTEPVRALLQKLTREPVVVRDLSSPAYRPPDRLREHVERRDRTCTFPGCTVPGQRCDLDHREPWPHGATSADNLHCLCRHHHRAKQASFTLTLDPATNDTVWTTPDGRRYRRPPPTY